MGIPGGGGVGMPPVPPAKRTSRWCASIERRFGYVLRFAVDDHRGAVNVVASSLARNSAKRAISDGYTTVGGMRAISVSESGRCGVIGTVRPVSVAPGQMALTRIPRVP